MSRFDAVMIGAGHNGLGCAAYLGPRRPPSVRAREGRGTRWVRDHGEPDRRPARIPLQPRGHRSHQPPGHPLLDDLDLANHGLKLIYHNPLWYFPFRDGTAITLYRDIDRTCESIAHVSEEDAEGYRRFNEMWYGIMALMAPFDYGPAPSLAQLGALAGAASYSSSGPKFYPERRATCSKPSCEESSSGQRQAARHRLGATDALSRRARRRPRGADCSGHAGGASRSSIAHQRPVRLRRVPLSEHSPTPVVVCGPGGDDPHAPDEYVNVDDLHTLASAYVRLVVDWCNRPVQGGA